MSATSAAAREPEDALRTLAVRLREEGSVISPYVVPTPEPPALGCLAAAGPRSASSPAGYAEVVELVREGYLLHYERPRLIDPPDQDLALLAGDYLYALGLEQLAGIGDLAAVHELSDLISLAAQAHAAGSSPGTAARRAGTLWLACATAIAVGPGNGYRAAKDLVRAGEDVRPLLRAAVEAASAAGLGERLSAAAEAVGFSPSDLG